MSKYLKLESRKGLWLKERENAEYLLEEPNDEDELHARAVEILEDTAKNKVSVEEQFKNFIVEEAKNP